MEYITLAVNKYTMSGIIKIMDILDYIGYSHPSNIRTNMSSELVIYLVISVGNNPFKGSYTSYSASSKYQQNSIKRGLPAISSVNTFLSSVLDNILNEYRNECRNDIPNSDK